MSAVTVILFSKRALNHLFLLSEKKTGMDDGHKIRFKKWGDEKECNELLGYFVHSVVTNETPMCWTVF